MTIAAHLKHIRLQTKVPQLLALLVGIGCNSTPATTPAADTGVTQDTGSVTLDARPQDDTGTVDAQILPTPDSGPSDSGPNDSGGRDSGPREEPDSGTITDSCACETSARCQTATDPYCTTFLASCGGDSVGTCDPDDALYRCEGPLGGTIYYSSYFFTDFAAQQRSCEDLDGTFFTTEPPAPVGEPCSCQRTASGCVTVYGSTACTALACTSPGVRSESACTTAEALDGQCVSIDGQRRVSYYGVSASDAQSSCRALDGYYWVPSGSGV